MQAPPNSPLSDFRYFTERETYLAWLASVQHQEPRRAAELSVANQLTQAPGHAQDDALHFYCHAHGGSGKLVHSANAITEDGYYWRESGACNTCGSITRIRLAAEWFARAAANSMAPRVYITEQLTSLYKVLRARFPTLVGSEFVPDATARAAASVTLGHFLGDLEAQIRHEDACHLSFTDHSFDLIGSFDVLEHIPDYPLALQEFFRVLRPGGQLLLTAPFMDASPKTLVRARIVGGDVQHIEPPEFHGNPTLPGEGALCFYHFGWDLLEDMRRVGFRSVALLSAWGKETAIFGAQCAVVATK